MELENETKSNWMNNEMLHKCFDKINCKKNPSWINGKCLVLWDLKIKNEKNMKEKYIIDGMKLNEWKVDSWNKTLLHI